MAKRQKIKKRMIKKQNAKDQEIQMESQIVNSSETSFTDLHVSLLYEIFRLKKRLQASTKENINIDSLSKAVMRMENVLQEHYYEIIDYTGCEYDEQAIFDEPRFIQSDEIKSEKGIITRVIYPQINYHDKAIKYARVEISKK